MRTLEDWHTAQLRDAVLPEPVRELRLADGASAWHGWLGRSPQSSRAAPGLQAGTLAAPASRHTAASTVPRRSRAGRS